MSCYHTSMDGDSDALDAFIREQTGSDKLPAADVDLFDGLGVVGDDCFEFITAFAKRFDVDMAGYLWYFHHGEEGPIGAGCCFGRRTGA